MYHFRKYLTREQIVTIPNLMSLFRLILIPVIICLYWQGRYKLAVAFVGLSALTDMLDGVVARRFNMVSDLGKMLDPVCDKLTHGALLVCLIRRYRYIRVLLALLAVKESIMLVLGWIAVKRRQTVHSAKWYGKMCTVVFEGVMIVLMLFPSIPDRIAHGMMGLCTAVMIFSLIMYSIFFLRVIISGATSRHRHP